MVTFETRPPPIPLHLDLSHPKPQKEAPPIFETSQYKRGVCQLKGSKRCSMSNRRGGSNSVSAPPTRELPPIPEETFDQVAPDEIQSRNELPQGIASSSLIQCDSKETRSDVEYTFQSASLNRERTFISIGVQTDFNNVEKKKVRFQDFYTGYLPYKVSNNNPGVFNDADDSTDAETQICEDMDMDGEQQSQSSQFSDLFRPLTQSLSLSQDLTQESQSTQEKHYGRHRSSTPPEEYFPPSSRPGYCICDCRYFIWLILAIVLLFFLACSAIVLWVSYNHNFSTGGTCPAVNTEIAQHVDPGTGGAALSVWDGDLDKEDEKELITRKLFFQHDQLQGNTQNSWLEWIKDWLQWLNENCGWACLMERINRSRGIYV